MKIQFNTPIALQHNDEGFWLYVTTTTGRSACLSLDSVGSQDGIIRAIFQEWAQERMLEAQLQRRRKTGVKCQNGELMEGDVVRINGIHAAVIWNAEVGAFQFQETGDHYAAWKSDNLADASKAEIIGNVFS